MVKPLDAFQQRIGYKFQDISLLELALTHRSFGPQHNERLEYLGDSIFNAVVSILVYRALPDLPEGQLSRIRSNIVKQSSMYEMALKLGFSACLRLGEGEAKSGGAKRVSILADALEALVGAIYLDGGFEKVERLTQGWLGDITIDASMPQLTKDAKTQLQEWVQARKLPLPSYSVISIVGASHNQTFDVQCAIPSLKVVERGLGSTRRTAEQQAAEATLNRLKHLP